MRCRIASRLRTSNRLKSQFVTGSEKVDTILVDLDPITEGRETSLPKKKKTIFCALFFNAVLGYINGTKQLLPFN